MTADACRPVNINVAFGRGKDIVQAGTVYGGIHIHQCGHRHLAASDELLVETLSARLAELGYRRTTHEADELNTKGHGGRPLTDENQ
ncbi:hypothetical protein [Amycolatopsis samaneae]|uniref:Uncharacterized protein n=1 Tax=Amycolatopsis samaneae TaxID=664691 RepID=A0ABW5G8F4_9PSEU